MAEQDLVGAKRSLDRFEGFTDAVFAIALTLLMVELKAPGVSEGAHEPNGLARALADGWRQYLGLFVSFWVIGVYWQHHHFTGRVYSATDHLFTLLNLVFLFGVGFIAFPIRLWAEHLGQGADQDTAATLLAWCLVIPSVGWMLKWLYAASRRRLVDKRLESSFVRRLTIVYVASATVVVFGALVSLAFPTAGLTIGLLVSAAYLLPPPKPRLRPDAGAPDEDSGGGE